jgi:hypothetical protein
MANQKISAKEIRVGDWYAYYPTKSNGYHLPALVEVVGRRIGVRVFVAGTKAGVVKRVVPWRLVPQQDMLLGLMPVFDKENVNDEKK